MTIVTPVLIPDVNVLVHAFRTPSPHHQSARAWLTATLGGHVPLGLLPGVISGFLRVVTNRRVFEDSDSAADAVAFVDALLAQPRVVLLEPTRVSWSLTRGLIEDQGLVGDDVPDAFIAGVVLAVNGTLASYDRGFARFAGLSRLTP